MPASEWMRGASSASDIQGLIDLCKPGSLLAPLTASGVSSATRSVTLYDGLPALALTLPGTNQGNAEPASIVVTDTQTPVLLNISEPGSGNFTFTGYGATKTIAPRPPVRRVRGRGGEPRLFVEPLSVQLLV